PDRHWLWSDSKLTELKAFWEQMAKVLEKIDPEKRDESFAEFLVRLPGISPEWKQLATDFVEGFDAARPERISVQALAKDEEASERIDGDQSCRVSNGYRTVIDWLELQLASRSVPVHRAVN